MAAVNTATTPIDSDSTVELPSLLEGSPRCEQKYSVVLNYNTDMHIELQDPYVRSNATRNSSQTNLATQLTANTTHKLGQQQLSASPSIHDLNMTRLPCSLEGRVWVSSTKRTMILKHANLDFTWACRLTEVRDIRLLES